MSPTSENRVGMLIFVIGMGILSIAIGLQYGAYRGFVILGLAIAFLGFAKTIQ